MIGGKIQMAELLCFTLNKTCYQIFHFYLDVAIKYISVKQILFTKHCLIYLFAYNISDKTSNFQLTLDIIGREPKVVLNVNFLPEI